MPKNKDIKRLTRSRMRKTGESYTAARTRLLEKREKPDHAALAGMSDDAVRKATGRDWGEWVRELDSVEAASWPHREIAAHLHEKHEIPGWWAQMVTVGYERIKGLREVGQRRGGSYDANKSKTLPVSVAKLYRAFSVTRTRTRWLGDVGLTVRKASREKSMRITWEDGTWVNIYFTAKGDSKAHVAIQHQKLAGKAEVERAKEFWSERLAALSELLVPSKRAR